MSNIYVMQRANGDLFALDDHGRFRLPLFRSSREAMLARSQNVEMLLFKPVALDASLLRKHVPKDRGTEVDFWLIDDPVLSLKRGRLIQPAELESLMNNPGSSTVSGDEKGKYQSVREVAHQISSQAIASSLSGENVLKDLSEVKT